MRMITCERWRLRGAVMMGVVLLAGAYLAGCSGASGPVKENSEPAPDDASRARDTMSPTAVVVNEWIEMIDEAEMTEYAQLGRDLAAQDRVRFVSPPTLDANFNAFAHIDTREIWINEPMFERYPDVLDQATIFLHELIHIYSGECTHSGPWWSAQSEFRAYYADLETSAVALNAPTFHDASIGVGP